MGEKSMAEYEFTDEQNRTFDKLASALQRFAILFGIFGVLMVVLGALNLLSGNGPQAGAAIQALAGVLIMVIAFLFLKPVQNFRRITTTSGQDISELLGAVGHLNTSHNLLRLVLGVMFLVAIIAVVMTMMR
jgi:hypothetical protein